MARAQKKISASDTQHPSEKIEDDGKKPTKTEKVIKLLKRKHGANLEKLQKATDWQPHSIRGFLSGLRKRGLKVERIKTDGHKVTYHIADT